MKKIILLAILLVSITIFAQDRKHEVRLNTFSVLASRNLDLSYEYLINEESAVGASFAFDVTGGEKYNLFGINQKYAITPYYRYYFPINGVFLETFLSANGGRNRKAKDDEDITDILDEGIVIEGDDDHLGFEYGDFAFGLGGGYKYVSESGFVAEIYGGAGRNLSDAVESPKILGRLGLSFGFKF